MSIVTAIPQVENKDIKLIDKKGKDTKDEEGKEFFENIIESIISDTKESNNKKFLLSKLLSLSSEFEKKEESISEFSDGKLFTEHQIGQVPIQDLLKIAMKLKNGEDLANFPTDSKSLKLALAKPEIAEEFKSAKTIKDLLKIAKKNDIEVKNFQFFKEEAALDSKDKKIVQKIKSEEIFKLIEKQLDVKTEKSVAALINPKEIIKDSKQKTTILQTLLASKEVTKPLITQVSKSEEKVEKKIITIKNEVTPIQDKVVETKTLKTLTTENIDVKIVETKSTIVDKKDIKPMDVKIIETIDIKPTDAKIVETKSLLTETKEIKKEQPQLETKIVKTDESIQRDKQKVVKSNFETALNLKKIEQTQINTIKTETMIDKKEIAIVENKESSDKTVVNTDIKTSLVEKTKDAPDLKRTFGSFAAEFKEKVENYKAPLMKIKMELKPAGMGEVDVTLISRGNNLQVNINSNANTIAMFAQNQVEFKNSLISMGFSDLQMNFGDGKQKDQNSNHQKNGKNVFDDFEEKQETDGFEMIVPQYG